MEERKTTFIEYLIIMPIVLGVDFIDMLAVVAIAIPIIGPILPLLMNIVKFAVTASLVFYCVLRRIDFIYLLGGGGMEVAMPFLSGMIPALSGAAFFTLYMPGHEKAQQVMGAVKAMAPSPFNKLKALGKLQTLKKATSQ